MRNKECFWWKIRENVHKNYLQKTYLILSKNACVSKLCNRLENEISLTRLCFLVLGIGLSLTQTSTLNQISGDSSFSCLIWKKYYFKWNYCCSNWLSTDPVKNARKSVDSIWRLIVRKTDIYSMQVLNIETNEIVLWLSLNKYFRFSMQ